MDIDFSDLRLVWPADLVRRVAARAAFAGVEYPSLVWLMAEAFVDSRGLPAVKEGQLPGVRRNFNVFLDGPPSAICSNYLSALNAGLNDGRVLPYAQPRYYQQRAKGPALPEVLTGEQLATAIIAELSHLDQLGYFDDAFGSSCCDDRVDRESEARALFVQHLGPDTPLRWIPDNDTHLEDLFDLVELCHDLVARPMTRSYHGFGEEWDYADFDVEAGRLVYRWRMNELLQRSDAGLRLSTETPDLGRLVATVDDPRAELPTRVLATPRSPGERDRVEHAIALFRGRNATREVKRDAVRSLGDVLESRRGDVGKHLGSRDEDALFQILNRFDIRHLNKAAQTDYGDDFLEWVFWTLLSTLAFIDGRTVGGTAAPASDDNADRLMGP